MADVDAVVQFVVRRRAIYVARGSLTQHNNDNNNNNSSQLCVCLGGDDDGGHSGLSAARATRRLPRPPRVTAVVHVRHARYADVRAVLRLCVDAADDDAFWHRVQRYVTCIRAAHATSSRHDDAATLPSSSSSSALCATTTTTTRAVHARDDSCYAHTHTDDAESSSSDSDSDSTQSDDDMTTPLHTPPSSSSSSSSQSSWSCRRATAALLRMLHTCHVFGVYAHALVCARLLVRATRASTDTNNNNNDDHNNNNNDHNDNVVASRTCRCARWLQRVCDGDEHAVVRIPYLTRQRPRRSARTQSNNNNNNNKSQAETRAGAAAVRAAAASDDDDEDANVAWRYVRAACRRRCRDYNSTNDDDAADDDAAMTQLADDICALRQAVEQQQRQQQRSPSLSSSCSAHEHDSDMNDNDSSSSDNDSSGMASLRRDVARQRRRVRRLVTAAEAAQCAAQQRQRDADACVSAWQCDRTYATQMTAYAEAMCAARRDVQRACALLQCSHARSCGDVACLRHVLVQLCSAVEAQEQRRQLQPIP